MALPLKDFRIGITESIYAALEAEAQAFGRDKAAIAREILEGWAKRKHRAYTVYARLTMANGVAPESDGTAPEEAGASRQQQRVRR